MRSLVAANDFARRSRLIDIDKLRCIRSIQCQTEVFRSIVERARRMRPTMAYLKEESLAIEPWMKYRLWQARYGIVGIFFCGALLEVEQDGSREAAGFVSNKESDGGRPIHLASPDAVYGRICG